VPGGRSLRRSPRHGLRRPPADAPRGSPLRASAAVPRASCARWWWVRGKQARVFQLWSERYPTLRVDLFLEPPFDFATAHQRRHRAEIAEGLEVSFVALDDLLAMKRVAARPQDLADVDRLERIRRASRSGD
jgi:hypothetical protein